MPKHGMAYSDHLGTVFFWNLEVEVETVDWRNKILNLVMRRMSLPWFWRQFYKYIHTLELYIHFSISILVNFLSPYVVTWLIFFSFTYKSVQVKKKHPNWNVLDKMQNNFEGAFLGGSFCCFSVCFETGSKYVVLSALKLSM